jgi:hypothetical protein
LPFGDRTGLSNPKGANKEQTGIDRGARTVTANGAHHCLILRREETKYSQTGMAVLLTLHFFFFSLCNHSSFLLALHMFYTLV